jgi:hypothetical protein
MGGNLYLICVCCVFNRCIHIFIYVVIASENLGPISMCLIYSHKAINLSYKRKDSLQVVSKL